MICIFISIPYTKAQRKLLEEDVTSYDLQKPKNGPNLLHFTHWYVDFGFFVPNPYQEDNQNVNFGKTHNFIIGYRYKIKATNWLAFGADAEYNSSTFNFKDNFFINNENLDYLIHNKEKLRINNVGGEIFIRFNFGKRGNVIGKFIDFAGYGLVNLYSKHIFVDKLSNPTFYNSKNVKTINTKLNYLELFNYGTRMRLGNNRFAICISYRFSEILKKDFQKEYNNLDLPKLNVDLQIGFH